MVRPVIYTPDILEKAQEYYDNLPQDEVVHSIEGLAEAIEVARATIYNWKGQEGEVEGIDEFLDIVSRILERQGKFLVNKGLTGEFNSKITMAMLSKHGYREEKGLVGAEGKDLFPSREDLEKANEAIENA